VPRSHVRPNPGKDLNIVAVHKAQTAFGIQPNQLLYVVRIDPAGFMATAPMACAAEQPG
jgi:hypothetical protein